MLKISTGLFLASMALALSGSGAAGCRQQQKQAAQDKSAAGKSTATQTSDAPTTPPAQTPTQDGEGKLKGEIKVLGEGNYSQVNDAFVAVARDASTYAALRALVKELPEMSADFFDHHAVVAAFLGQRRTGGYRVNVTRKQDGALQLEQQSPPKGSLTTQALTAPFKVVSVETGDSRFRFENELRLELGAPWQMTQRPFRVTSGEFRMIGGFAAHKETFGLAGEFGMMRERNLATFVFRLKSSGGGATRPRALEEVATGLVQQDQLTIPYLEAGTLVDAPRSALRARGSFGPGENKLSLQFDSLPTNVADGYGGDGKLEAEATAPPPQRNRPADEM